VIIESGPAGEVFPGDRFVWEIPDMFGPIYCVVDRVIGGIKPRAVLCCRPARGPEFRSTRTLPLSPMFERRDWTDADLIDP